MTDTLEQKIEIMLAAQRGEQIQRRNRESTWRDYCGTPGFVHSPDWTDVEHTDWNFSVHDYRVAPPAPEKPRIVQVRVEDGIELVSASKDGRDMLFTFKRAD